MRILLSLVLLLVSNFVVAQHCPLDGGKIVAVKLVDAKGNWLETGKDTLFLQEIENDSPTLCNYAAELLRLPLLDTTALFRKYQSDYGNVYVKALRKRLSEAGVSSKSNFFVVLSQAQGACMIKNGNDFNYRERRFAVTLHYGGKQLSVPLHASDIYKLCVGSNELDKFRPVVVRVF